MVTWSNLNLQDSASPLMEQLMFFHDHSLMILIMITMLVGYLMITVFFYSLINQFLLEGQTIEVIWTILPAITLIFIALPSLRLFYLLDEIHVPWMKLMIHQLLKSQLDMNDIEAMSIQILMKLNLIYMKFPTSN